MAAETRIRCEVCRVWMDPPGNKIGDRVRPPGSEVVGEVIGFCLGDVPKERSVIRWPDGTEEHATRRGRRFGEHSGYLILEEQHAG